MMELSASAAAANTHWEQRGLLRTPGIFESAQDPVTLIDGREYLLFSSSNYLSLASHPEVLGAAADALTQFGAGSGGSRLTTGSTSWHVRAEEEFARFVGSEDSVYFATGYQANLSTIAAMAKLSDSLTLYSDARNHASIIDGCRLAKVPLEVFPHADLSTLEALLAERATRDALVISDGLFSMDGTLADLPGLQKVCRAHGAWLMLDDAHAIGTVGATGHGSAEHFGSALPEILVGTASKALGSEGGFIACSAQLGQFLRNQARSFVFSTATAAAAPASIVTALHLVPDQVVQLQKNVSYLRELLQLPASSSPIIPIPVGDEAQAMQRSAELKELGMWVPAIRYPTVARGEAILRVTVMAGHTTAQLEELALRLRAQTISEQRIADGGDF